LATLEKKEVGGQQVEITLPTRFDTQEACTCNVGLHPNWVQPIPVGKITYEPGKTYKVPTAVAAELQAKLTELEKTPWEYVVIPRVDIYGYKFASGSIRINKDLFTTGETHKVPGNLASELKRIVSRRQSHDLTLMSKDINMEALQQLAGGESLTKAAAAGNVPVVGSPEQLAQLASMLH